MTNNGVARAEDDRHPDGESPVMVTVIGADGGGDEITLHTRGDLLELPDGWMLHYDETHADSVESMQTLIECRGDNVTVTRAGSVISTIVYSKGETFVGEYETQMGTLQLRVFPTAVHTERNGRSGHIRLEYQVSLSSDFSYAAETAMRWLDISFEPCNE